MHNKDKNKLATNSREEADKIQSSRKEKMAVLAARDITDLQSMMKNDFGRRFICKLLEDTGIFRPSFTGNSSTFYNEGQRSIALLYIPALEEHCAADYILMQQERLNRIQENR